MIERLWNRLLAQIAGRHAAHQLARFKKSTTDCQAIQQAVLLRKLTAGADSDFGRDHDLARLKTVDDFRTALPLGGYERFAPYIERVKAGQTQALFSPVTTVHMFALTSGTTDQPKFIPVTESFAADYQRGWNIWGLAALLDHRDAWLRQIVQIGSPVCEFTTAAGIACGAISGALARRQKRIVRKMYTVPGEVFSIADAGTKYYTILRLALGQDVAWLTTANPSTLLALARCGDAYSEALIRDLHDGTLTPPGPITQPLYLKLKPDRQTARRLRKIRRQNGGRFLPRDYFNLSFLAHWTGGTLGLYLKELPDYYGNIPSRDIGLLASEGRVTIPLQDHSSAGVLDLGSHFFEFIPEADDEQEQPGTRLAHELEMGQKYFVVLTTSAGLYRYRLGDLVEVTGFTHSTPILEFLSKGAHTSSLTGEKLTEHQIVSAVRRVAEKHHLPLKVFVLAPVWSRPPFYRLYVEGSQTRETLAAEVDRELRAANLEYDSKRASDRLGPIQLNQLDDGFFAQYDAKCIGLQRGRSEQYKHKYLFTRVEEGEQLTRETGTPRRGDVE